MVFDLILSYDTILRVCWFVLLLISIYEYLQVGSRGMYQKTHYMVFDSILSYGVILRASSCYFVANFDLWTSSGQIWRNVSVMY
jgi:hypothetical protein